MLDRILSGGERGVDAHGEGNVADHPDTPERGGIEKRRIDLARQLVVDLDLIVAVVNEAGDELLHLGGVRHLDRGRPDRVRAVHDVGGGEDARPHELARRDAAPVLEVRLASRHVAHQRHSGRHVQQHLGTRDRILVASGAGHVTREMSVHVGEARYQVAPAAIDEGRAFRHRYLVAATEGGDPPVFDHDRLLRQHSLLVHRHNVDVDERDGRRRLLARRPHARGEREYSQRERCGCGETPQGCALLSRHDLHSRVFISPNRFVSLWPSNLSRARRCSGRRVPSSITQEGGGRRRGRVSQAGSRAYGGRPGRTRGRGKVTNAKPRC